MEDVCLGLREEAVLQTVQILPNRMLFGYYVQTKFNFWEQCCKVRRTEYKLSKNLYRQQDGDVIWNHLAQTAIKKQLFCTESTSLVALMLENPEQQYA